MNEGRVRRALLVPAAAALAGLVVLLGLGTWQLERKAWKEALIVTLDRRLNDAPIALPPPAEWAGMASDNWEFAHIRVRVEFLKTFDALVYTGGSSLRDDVKGTGCFVLSPARLPDGLLVVINRGFVPERSQPAACGPYAIQSRSQDVGSFPTPSGPQDVVGYLRWP